jgi:ankyrin repeat protein
MYAVNCGHLESVIEMIPFADITAINDALCWAASEGHTSILRSILENSEASANAIESIRSRSRSHVDGGCPALMLAVRSMEPQCVKILLDHGADVHKIDERSDNQGYIRGSGNPHGIGRTALHVFASRNFNSTEVASGILRLLLAAGANLEACDNEGNTPLLLNTGNYQTNGILTLQLLIEAGADACASDLNGETLLHRVCSNSQDIKLVALLLASGANPRAVRQSDGATPFHW